jgi:transcriptional regulator with XRE-family HTH domain
MNLGARFGSAVGRRRKALKLTASEVARRTAELGYPVSRGAIAQIESNSRAGKVDVAELFVLALALDIPPVLLLFDGYPQGRPVEIRPSVDAEIEDAVRWVSGRISAPRKVVRDTVDGHEITRVGFGEPPKPPNDGVKLIAATSSFDQALLDRVPLMVTLENAQNQGGDIDTTQRMLHLNDERIEALRQEIYDAQVALWALDSDADHAEGFESDD